MRVVVQLSGGLDSTVLLSYHLRAGDEVRCIGFDYGQRHAARELAAARIVAQSQGVDYQVVSVPLVGIAASALTGCGDVPHGHYEDKSMIATVVPCRNSIFACIAAAYALSCRFDAVSIAAHGGDRAIYPDCRQEWIDAMQQAIRLGNWGAEHLRLLAPFVAMSKADIVRVGWQVDAPFAATWSCYEGGSFHCGRCGTCVERQEAFEIAGVRDPTYYGANP
jgi:7-cyano-7-deazaguanine synthase